MARTSQQPPRKELTPKAKSFIKLLEKRVKPWTFKAFAWEEQHLALSLESYEKKGPYLIVKAPLSFWNSALKRKVILKAVDGEIKPVHEDTYD